MNQNRTTETKNTIGLAQHDVEAYGGRLFLRFYCVLFGSVLLFSVVSAINGIFNGFGPKFFMISVFMVCPILVCLPLLFFARIVGRHLGRLVGISRPMFLLWVPGYAIVLALGELFLVFCMFLLGHAIGINPNHEGLGSKFHRTELPIFVLSIFIFTIVNIFLALRIINKYKQN